MTGRCLLLLFILLIGAVAPAYADPPDPQPVPVPNEDVLRPRLPGGERWFGQVAAGLNLTFLSGNPVLRAGASFEGRTDLFESATGLGPLLYGAIGCRYSPNFSVRVRLDLDGKRAGRSGATIDTCILRDAQTGQIIMVPSEVDKDYSVSVTYLTLSLLPAVHIDDLYIFAGPSIGLPVARSIEETDRVVDQQGPCAYFPATNEQSKVISGRLTGTDNVSTRLAFKIGAGYAIKLAPQIDLCPEVGFDIGRGDAFSQAGGVFETVRMTNPDALVPQQAMLNPINNAIRLSSLQVAIGLQFGM